MSKVKILVILSLLLLLVAYSWASEVKNTVARQVGNRVTFTYDLIGDKADAEVTVTITVQGKSYQTSNLHLEGDFGKVRTGRGKTIQWNVLQDFPKGISGTIVWEIVAGGKVYVSMVTGAKFILIPAGTFTIETTSKAYQVTISKPFYMQTTELTQGQWRKVMGNNPSYFSSCGDDCPVESVSWNDVQDFISKLNIMEGTDKYRLPTEAEWEYAARSGGKRETFSGTNSTSELGNYAWYTDNTPHRGTNPVGQKKPNELGLYDMTGNVSEWCQDWYGDYPSNQITYPKGPSSGSERVYRGGDFFSSAMNCRVIVGGARRPNSDRNNLGFRLLKTP
jgi:formylglycine-generating enzyme required for sulfatase activity